MHHMALGGEADPRHGAARSRVARAARPARPAQARRALPRRSAREQFHALYKLHDDELGRLPRRVVRVRSAQGDEVGERHHRHVPRPALARHRVRAAAPLHGRDRRRVPRLGLREGRHRRDQRRRSPRARARIRRRDPHRTRRSSSVLVEDGRATGVVLENGDEIARRLVVSGARSAPHLPRAGRARSTCRTSSSRRSERFKFRGSSGKVNLALERAAGFHLPAAATAPHLRGAISISPSVDYLERAYDDAKYGEFSRQPVHGHRHPVDDRSGDGAAGQARDVDLRAVRALPPERRLDRREARGVRRRGDRHARALRAEHQVARSCTGRCSRRPTSSASPASREGNIFQGELALQQLFFLRPAPAWAQYRTPIDGLLAVRRGHASRRRHHGRLGPQCRARDPRGTRLSCHAIVIGAGVDALVAAHLLARRGQQVLVVEERAPAARDFGWVPSQVIGELGLALALDAPDPWATALLPGRRQARALARCRAAPRTRSGASASAMRKDGRDFCRRMAALARLFERLYLEPPADPLNLRFALRVRGLGREGMVDLMRLLPMPVAELLDDWFEMRCAQGRARGDGHPEHPAGTALRRHRFSLPASSRRQPGRRVPSAAHRPRLPPAAAAGRGIQDFESRKNPGEERAGSTASCSTAARRSKPRP